jgi:predicted RNA methylase
MSSRRSKSRTRSRSKKRSKSHSSKKKMSSIEGGDKISKGNQIKLKPSDLKMFFPTSDVSILKKLKMTKECLYSTTAKVHADYIRDLIMLFYAKEKYKDLVVTDATSCIGGTFMSLVKPFGKINAVELNQEHAELMDYNISLIFPKEKKKVTVINENYLSVWNTFKPKSNVVIIDPPWGGIDYTKHKKMKLYLNDADGKSMELMDIIKMILPETDMVFARVPYNYERNQFKKLDCAYVKPIRFIKEYGNKRTKTLYYIYIISHFKPLKDPMKMNVVKYHGKVNYRQMQFEVL